MRARRGQHDPIGTGADPFRCELTGGQRAQRKRFARGRIVGQDRIVRDGSATDSVA